MFGRKKRRWILKIWDECGALIFSDELSALDVPEGIVLTLSREFFNDPHPCEIHRSAVLSRVFAELEEALPLNVRKSIGCLSDIQCRCLPRGAFELGLFEEEKT